MYIVFCLLIAAISEERLAEAFDRIDADDSGYISAANLKALLGNDFPQAEIDEIIREADLTKDGRISYSEFLALWEDKNETKHQNDIQEIQKLMGKHESERSSLFSASEEDSEDDDAVDLPARINFLEEKRLSERRASADGVQAGQSSSSPKGTTNGKHVGFNSDVDTIPVVNFVEEEG
jgi:Ca2+-binding EF-hand superfamily protein